MLKRPKICTERLVLNPARVSDQEQLAELWRDPDVRRYLWDDRHVEPQGVTDILEASDSSFQKGSYGIWKIHLLDDTFIGFVGLRGADWDEDEVELLYGLYPAYWGQGYATEASRGVLRHAFDVCNLPRVIAAFDSPNEASGRVLERIGMKFDREGELDGLATKFYSLEASLFLRT